MKNLTKIQPEPEVIPKKINKIELIEKANQVHGYKYNYERLEYINSKTKVLITCLKHGDFYQNLSNHLRGQGCPNCYNEIRGQHIINAAKKRRNKHYSQPEDYKLIPLTQDKFAMVDNEDFEKISKYNWQHNHYGYAKNDLCGLMHRFIMNPEEGYDIDHINHNTLDNRKSNLRICTHAENSRNTRKRKWVKYKGVNFDKRYNKWASSIMINYKKKFLGYFDKEIDAAKAYDKAAIEMHGEFSKTNF